MKKPVLVIMAAGMGSRYGGMKQIDPVDEQGHIIMDFSIYDALRAGFEEVVFIIKKENEQIFREVIGDRVARKMKVRYIFQQLEDLPEGYAVPEGRTRPWGTGHAVLAARDVIDGPFAVINADDYYGCHAFSLIYDELTAREEEDGPKIGAVLPTSSSAAGLTEHYVMVGYLLKNTVTENGSVARGVCATDERGHLTSIIERTKIIKKGADAAYTEDDGATWSDLPGESIVSMNMWGFPGTFMSHLKEEFPAFLDRTLRENPLKGEFFLPFVVNDLMKAGRAQVKVLTTPDVWHGVTYKEDKKDVEAAVRAMKADGLYPEVF